MCNIIQLSLKYVTEVPEVVIFKDLTKRKMFYPEICTNIQNVFVQKGYPEYSSLLESVTFGEKKKINDQKEI